MSEPAKRVALKLTDVHAGYGMIQALRGISLSVEEGEIVALIGANGAGKSTTLNTICGLVQARAGQIELFGERIEALPTKAIVARGVSQSPEGRRLFSDMSVLENLEMGAFLRDDDAIGKDIEEAYELFPILRERKHQAAGSLSGGEQQMCAVARCMMARPKVMLLDEPSLGLAPLICQDIFDVIERLNREHGTTIFLVEQNAQAALKLAHRGYVLETGQVAMEGPAADLLADPRVQEAYLGV